jgi:hydroxymethylbilane synthase
MAKQPDPTAPAAPAEGRAVRIGTRGSPLARAQAAEAARRLGGSTEVVAVRTSGDFVTHRPLADVGGKGLFTRELDAALVAGDIDIAVHSLKDVPTRLEGGLVLGCVLPREDPRDVLLGAPSVTALPVGATVGTASLRRGAQVLHARPDVRVVQFRGDVATRLRKLAEGEADATLLALAGLHRLGLGHGGGIALAPEEMLPAVAQGAIGIAARDGDTAMLERLAALDHGPTATAVTCERALLAALDGSCRTPIAALAEAEEGGGLRLRASLLTADGAKRWDAERIGLASEAAAMGADAGAELRGRAGADFPAG